MTSIFIVGAAVALVITVAIVHRGHGLRTRQLQLAAATILAAAVLREYGAAYGDTVLLDLLKRLLFLATEASVVVALLTYRRAPISRQDVLRVWALAGAVGIMECLLAATMPTRDGGGLYSHTEAGSSVTVFLYYALYEATIAATALTCSVGSISVLARTRQPFSTRTSLVLMTLAATATVAYVGIGWFALLEHPGFDYLATRRNLFLAVIVLLFAGLALGGIHRIVVRDHTVLKRGADRRHMGLIGKEEDTSGRDKDLNHTE